MTTLNSIFTCPMCESAQINLLETNVLMSDVRTDIVQCAVCNTIWKAYSKVQETAVELLQQGQVVPTEEGDTLDVPEVLTEIASEEA